MIVAIRQNSNSDSNDNDIQEKPTLEDLRSAASNEIEARAAETSIIPITQNRQSEELENNDSVHPINDDSTACHFCKESFPNDPEHWQWQGCDNMNNGCLSCEDIWACNKAKCTLEMIDHEKEHKRSKSVRKPRQRKSK